MRLSPQILLASTNRDKHEEFKALFSAYPDIEILSASEIIRNPRGLGLVEKYDTYLENSIAKARLANQGAHYPTLADDSGLEVLALDGKPGVRSHRFAPPEAGMSQDQANMKRLLRELQGKPRRDARFVCSLVLLLEGIMLHSTGILEGAIVETPRGTQGFGYDPVFVPKGSAKTLAEMSDGEKNSISHRAKALDDLMQQVQANGIVFAKP